MQYYRIRLTVKVLHNQLIIKVYLLKTNNANSFDKLLNYTEKLVDQFLLMFALTP